MTEISAGVRAQYEADRAVADEAATRSAHLLATPLEKLTYVAGYIDALRDARGSNA